MTRTIPLITGVVLSLSGCLTPTGKPYNEGRASRLALGTSGAEVVTALGKPWQAEPLRADKQDPACVGPSEAWTYSYDLPAKIHCESTLSFDQRGALCARVTATTLPGAQCQGVK